MARFSAPKNSSHRASSSTVEIIAANYFYALSFSAGSLCLPELSSKTIRSFDHRPVLMPTSLIHSPSGDIFSPLIS